MKLTKIQVKNFRSIDDSGEFEIDDLTCLVGKNEAGKTAILRAIHGLAPTDDFKYDKTRDYEVPSVFRLPKGGFHASCFS